MTLTSPVYRWEKRKGSTDAMRRAKITLMFRGIAPVRASRWRSKKRRGQKAEEEKQGGGKYRSVNTIGSHRPGIWGSQGMKRLVHSIM